MKAKDKTPVLMPSIARRKNYENKHSSGFLTINIDSYYNILQHRKYYYIDLNIQSVVSKSFLIEA